MIDTQTTKMKPDEFSRCEERSQMPEPGKNLSPIQETDAVLTRSINHALWEDNVLRGMDHYDFDVYVKNGTAYLNGHTINTTSKSRIENAIRSVPDILGIKNDLVLDDKLTLEVAASLGKLEHTYSCKFFTGVSHGVVSVYGVVSDEKVKLSAEKCAANNQNVRGVISNVRVSGAEPGSQELPFLQPAIGKVIYFLDGISAVVKQVIINPNNRRVIAMIVQGQFAGQQDEIDSLTDGKARLPEQLIVIPMNVVHYLTRDSGFLSIQSSERNRYRAFDPSRFMVPDKNWLPPYPYCLDDILFPIEYQEANVQIADPPRPSPFASVSENASLMRRFFANDSLGG